MHVESHSAWPLEPASSTRHSVLGVRPHCGTYQQFIPRYRCFLYPPARRWTFGVLPLGAFSERCHEELIPVRVFGFSCGCLLSISRGRGIARALGDSALSLLGTCDSVSQRGRTVIPASNSRGFRSLHVLADTCCHRSFGYGRPRGREVGSRCGLEPRFPDRL